MPQTPTSLPTPRAFLTSLLNTFSTSQPLASNPDSSIDVSLSSNAAAPLAPFKSLLLTLHALFPNTLLPALDLLDRRLVTRLVYAPSSGQHAEAVGGAGDGTGTVLQAASGEGNKELGKRIVYYVKSSAQRDGRSRHGSRGNVGATSYEVRTKGWSCSCAAFAFAAFNAHGEGRKGFGCEDYDDYSLHDDAVHEDEVLLHPEEEGDGVGRREETEDWQWGGLMVEEDVPLCKHLLACVLAEHWGVAGGMIEERKVGREEMAGWAAGWGE